MLAAGFVEDGDALVLRDHTGVSGVRSVLAAMRTGAPPSQLLAPAAPSTTDPVAVPVLVAPALLPAAADAQPVQPPPQPAQPPPQPAQPPQQPAQPPPPPAQPQPPPQQPMDVDEDDELQAALQMSMATAVQPEPAAPTAPEPTAPEPAASLESLIRSHFARLVGQGLAPNEAALQALSAAHADLAAAGAANAGADAGGAAKRARGMEGAASVPEAAAAAIAASAVEESAGSVEFVRFEAESVVTAASQVDQINAWYAAYGDPFIDPSFPPAPKSLYLSASSAGQWKCSDCQRLNPIPNLPPMQQLYGPQGDALRRQHRLICAGCSSEASVEQCLARPTKWLSARADRIRDDVTLQFFDSVPWTVFREQPRPDDIRQGALGDCWFVCALSMLAEEPSLVRRIFSYDGEAAHAVCDFNRAGAYVLRLCRAGEWHTVLVDDNFPATELDTFAYSKAARRQLWVPLVEKAAAKLHGCYEALEAGTLAEALTMLTGYATERILLHRYREGDDDLAALAALDPARAAAIAALSAEQQERREKARAEDRAEREHADVDELFLGLLSRRAAGFVMGAACVDRRARELGLQAPHAYGILELTEVEVREGDEAVRLVKLRNPAGVSSWAGRWGPKSELWTHEAKQALGVDREDGGVFWMAFDDFVQHFASVEVCRVRPSLTEVRARGWLASQFGLGEAVTVSSFARTELDLALYQEGHSARGGSGARTLLDLGMLLLKRSSSAPHEAFGGEGGGGGGEAGGGGSGFEVVALVKRSVQEQVGASAAVSVWWWWWCGGAGADKLASLGHRRGMRRWPLDIRRVRQSGGHSMPACGCAHTSPTPPSRCDCTRLHPHKRAQAFTSTTLELDGYEGEYVVVPLCFHQLHSTEPRRFVVAAHSTQPVLLQPTPLSHSELAAALAQVTAEHGERKPLGRSTFISSWKDEAGAVVLVENASATEHAHVTIDCEMSTGMLSSRGARATRACRRAARCACSRCLPALPLMRTRAVHSAGLGLCLAGAVPGCRVARCTAPCPGCSSRCARLAPPSVQALCWWRTCCPLSPR